MSSASEVQQAAEKPRNTSNLISKVVTAIAKLWLVLVIILCLLIGFVLTPWGTKAVVNTTNSLVDELTIDYRSGGLGTELHLTSVKWKQAASKVDIYNLQLSIGLSCVWRLALCIDSVSSDKMLVQIQPTAPSSSDDPTTSALTLPFPVSIQNLSINKFSLKVKDTADITWQTLTANLEFYQRLRIEKMQLHGFDLTTYATDRTF